MAQIHTIYYDKIAVVLFVKGAKSKQIQYAHVVLPNKLEFLQYLYLGH